MIATNISTHSHVVVLLVALTHLLLWTELVGVATAAATPVEEIVEGTDDRCPGFNLDNDVKTYVFTSSNIQRCFQVYNPSPTNDQPNPVMIMAHGSGSNSKLWCGKNNVRDSFASLDVTLLCTSAGTVESDPIKPTRWRAPPEGSTEANPYPCTEDDSIDVAYFESILDWIASQPSQFDPQRIFNGGFSQGSMFASYASFCFHDRLRGFATSGSGLKVNGPAVEWCSDYDDNRQGFCQIGVTDGWKNTGGFGECDDCRFYPIRPLDGATDVVGEPLKACIHVGENDSRVHGSDQYRYYFEEAGLRTEFTIHPDLNHSMPPDWVNLYNDCLGFTDDLPPPVPSPTPGPTASPSDADPTTTCVDDPNWRLRGNSKRDCGWIGTRRNAPKRCNQRANNPNSDRTKVRVYCKATCDAAGDAAACS